MSYFLGLLAIICATLALSYFTRHPATLTFSTVCLTLIVALYIFGLFGALYPLGIATLCLFILSGALALWHMARRRELSKIKDIFSPIFLIIVLFAFVQYFALGSAIVFGWDELTHWGLVVKNMFYSADFGRDVSATTMFAGYPPGASLFLYFFVMTGAEFEPSHLYMAMNLLNIGMLAHVCSVFKTMRRKLLCLGIMLITALALNVSMLLSIWNDTFMSCLFGYIMINYFTSRKEAWYRGVNITNIILASAVLSLSKSTGIVFVIFAYIIIFFDLLMQKRRENKRHAAFAFLSAILVSALSWLSWRIYSSLHSLGEAWSDGGLTVGAILKFVVSPTEYQSLVTKNFFREFLLPYHSVGNAMATPIPYPLTIVGFGALIWLIAKRAGNKKYLFSLGIPVALTFTAWVISLLISYVFTFSANEAINVASFVRYMNTYVSGVIFALVALLLTTLPEGEREDTGYKRPYAITAALLLTVSIIVTPILSAVMDTLYKPYKHFDSFTSRLDKDKTVYSITEGEGAFKEYLFLRFFATPNDSSGYKKGGSPHTGDPWSPDMTPAQTLAAIQNGSYDYLYLHSVSDEFCERYIGLFSDTPRSYTFYVFEDGMFKAVNP